ncbi:MAG: MarR family transcriptional regulator [Acidobacteria bacterium]|nr:MarR family transcriptional regulator [Acidobacteriota bacterium]
MRDKLFEEARQVFAKRFPDLDHTTVGMVGALSNAYHLLYAVMERAMVRYGVTPPSLDVMVVLFVRDKDGCTLGEIGELLGVSPANITGLVDGLVRKGLVSRVEHAMDRRKRLARLTDKGTEMMGSFIPDCAGFLHNILSPVAPGELRQLQDSLLRVANLLVPFWEKRGEIGLEREAASASPPRKRGKTPGPI